MSRGWPPRKRPFAARVANVTCTSADDGRRLAQFAYRCVAETPLDSGQTPFSMLTGQPAIQDGVRLVGQWLAGEAVSVAQIKEAWTSARREADTLAKDMVGATAAQWAAIAAIEAAEGRTRRREDGIRQDGSSRRLRGTLLPRGRHPTFARSAALPEQSRRYAASGLTGSADLRHYGVRPLLDVAGCVLGMGRHLDVARPVLRGRSPTRRSWPPALSLPGR